MAQGTSKRKLAAILSADVVGYSRLMQDDDAATVATLQEYRAAIARVIDRHSGRVVNAPGDNILAEFPSAVEAVQCAAETQKVLEGRNLELPAERRMEFRIGVNLGDIIEEADGTIYGDGVNVAARMESLATAGNVCISGKVYEEVQDKIEFKLEFMGDHSVKNIANPIPVYRVLSNGGQSPVAAIPSSGAILERPALAVLPLTNMSGDPEQEYFADGLTEDLITALAAWRSFPVIARNSTFAYKGTSQDVRQVASELGARYILEGSVGKSGNRVRITAQLIDASSGHHVWAEKFDRDLDDVFAVQDEITLRIAATVEPAVGKIERKRSVVKPAKSLVAWDYYQRGMSELNTYTKTGSAQARVLFDQAIALDGTYSQAYSGMAWSHVLDLLLQHTPEPEEADGEAARRGPARGGAR